MNKLLLKHGYRGKHGCQREGWEPDFTHAQGREQDQEAQEAGRCSDRCSAEDGGDQQRQELESGAEASEAKEIFDEKHDHEADQIKHFRPVKLKKYTC